MDAPSAAPATGNGIGAEAAGPATRPPVPNEPSAQDLLEMVRNLHAQQHLTHLKQLDADEQKWRDTHQEQWQQQWQQLWQQLQTDWELRRLGFDHAQRRHDLIAARLLNVFEDLKLLPDPAAFPLSPTAGVPRDDNAVASSPGSPSVAHPQGPRTGSEEESTGDGSSFESTGDGSAGPFGSGRGNPQLGGATDATPPCAAATNDAFGT